MAPFFDGPFFSILLCLLAGVALRYAIYHAQDCAANEEASHQSVLEHAQQAFRERHLTLQGALETALQNETALRARMADLIAEADSLRGQQPNTSSAGQDAAASEWRKRVGELEEELEHREAMLRELRLQKEEALTHLERERNLRQETTVGMSNADLRQAASFDDFRDLAELPRILAFSNDPESTGFAGDVRTDPLRGAIYDRPPQFRDDLRRISGIGEILAARLNQLGVYTFKQIMQWEPRHVKEFSRLLSFRDRIERDHWVAQARRLYQESHGEAA